MAKVGFYLRGARGKLAGAVFQRGADGSTVAREIVKPKNPKTSGQLAQRMIFATATAAYSKMKAICDHSWEGVQYGSKSQQVFMKRNLQMLRGRAAENEGQFLAKGVNVLMDNPYIISKGSLSAPINISITDAGFKLNVTPFGDNPKIWTVKDFCNALGIDKGDQLTFVVIGNNEDDIVAQYDNLTYGNSYFEYMRMTVKADADDNDVVFDDDTENWGPAIIAESYGVLAPEALNTGTPAIGITANYDVLAGAVIRSKKSGNQWLRSNATMTMTGGATAFKFLKVLQSWYGDSTPLTFDNPYILNNAEQGTDERPVPYLNSGYVYGYTQAGELEHVRAAGVQEGNDFLVIAKPDESDPTKAQFYQRIAPTNIKLIETVYTYTGNYVTVENARSVYGLTINIVEG